VVNSINYYRAIEDSATKYYLQVFYKVYSKNPDIKVYVKNIKIYVDGVKIFESSKRQSLDIWLSKSVGIVPPLHYEISYTTYMELKQFGDYKTHNIKVVLVLEQEFLYRKISKTLEISKIGYIGRN